MRWVEIDEDIHISNLTDGVQPVENAIADIFRKFPILMYRGCTYTRYAQELTFPIYYGTKNIREARDGNYQRATGDKVINWQIYKLPI